MIYRRWSLLTGPAVVVGGIVATLVVANFIFLDDPFRKPEQRKPDSSSSTK